MTKQLTAEDIEAAFASVAKRNLGRCNVGQLIADYPMLKDKIMDVEHYSAPTIQKVLKALDLPVPSTENINRHRRGCTRCPKED